MTAAPEVTVIRRMSFEAEVLGGHSRHPCEIEISVSGPVDRASGCVVDFDVLRDLLRKVVAELSTDPRTAENVAVACWRALEPRVAPARVRAVRVWETPNQGAEYHGP